MCDIWHFKKTFRMTVFEGHLFLKLHSHLGCKIKAGIKLTFPTPIFYIYNKIKEIQPIKLLCDFF